MQRNRGFTLLEALIVMAIVSVLACIAIPSFRNASAAAHGASAKASFVESWLAAVNHAALTGSEVVMCPAGPGDCRDATDWSQGWIVYADLDGNRSRDARETLLRRIEPLDGGVRLRSTVGRTRLVFQPNGGNAGSNATFTLCDDRGVASASTLVMSNQGRLRQGKPTPEAALACVYGP